MTDTTRADRRAALIAAGAIADDTPPVALLDGEPYRPNVPKRVRDAVYWATLAVAAASLLASGLAGIWTPGIAPQVVATTGVATGVMGLIGGGVGVIYRPGAQR
ncbi:hypothetical protein [Microbacterium soli]|uniref:Uncharacterized protein n=1 Tax=Microbacterium soli TaxID=446075 RepID=A0ABP7NKH2_9MICO